MISNEISWEEGCLLADILVTTDLLLIAISNVGIFIDLGLI